MPVPVRRRVSPAGLPRPRPDGRRGGPARHRPGRRLASFLRLGSGLPRSVRAHVLRPTRWDVPGRGPARRSAGGRPGRTLHGLARRFFTDRRLQQYVGRYATYAGSSPYRAPAALGCVPAIEHGDGGWYVPGGLARLAGRSGGTAGGGGADVRTGSEVTRILADGESVEGVVLASGEREGRMRSWSTPTPPRCTATSAPRPAEGAPNGSAGAVLVGASDPRGRRGTDRRAAAPLGAVLGRLPPRVRRHLPPPRAAAGPDRLHRLLGGGRPVPGTARGGEPGDAGQRSGRRPLAMADDAGVLRELVLERLARRGHDLAGRLRFVECFTPRICATGTACRAARSTAPPTGAGPRRCAGRATAVPGAACTWWAGRRTRVAGCRWSRWEAASSRPCWSRIFPAPARRGPAARGLTVRR